MNTVKEIKPEEEVIEKIGAGSLWIRDGKDFYILVRKNISPREVCLMSLEDGLAWNNGVKVYDTGHIDNEEWKTVRSSGNFTRVHAIEIRSDDD